MRKLLVIGCLLAAALAAFVWDRQRVGELPRLAEATDMPCEAVALSRVPEQLFAAATPAFDLKSVHDVTFDRLELVGEAPVRVVGYLHAEFGEGALYASHEQALRDRAAPRDTRIGVWVAHTKDYGPNPFVDSERMTGRCVRLTANHYPASPRYPRHLGEITKVEVWPEPFRPLPFPPPAGRWIATLRPLSD